MYTLHVGRYSGTGGDSLSYHNGGPFSTLDKDNDDSDANCARKYKGGRWYKDCHHSNLNGFDFKTSDETPFSQGIVWMDFTSYDSSLKSVTMSIKPMPKL